MKCINKLIFIIIVIIGSCSKPTEKPNVIIVITDDQGYGDLACHGNPWLKTPNIDKLYSQSVRLTDFHVSTTCSPTRGALMTGHYTNRAGSWHTISGREMVFEHETMLPEILVENGYSTGIFGKWHLGDNHPFRPQDNGFQETFVHLAGGVGQSPDFWLNNYFNDTYFRNGIPEKVEGYCTDVWFNNALEYIDRKTDEKQPFFCYLSTNAPHGPYWVADKYSKPYKENNEVVNPAYYGMIANIDKNMGRLLEYLDKKGISDNTILVFMTDNGTTYGGGILQDKQGFVHKGYNAGMRGSKGSMYEGGHRVPFFIRWPKGGIGGGKDINDLTAHIDISPTLIDAIGIEVDNNLNFDGISLLDLLKGKVKKLEERVLVTDTQRKLMPEKWKMSSTMKDKWRLINGEELYNIENDPEQIKDISNKHIILVEELRSAYEAWWSDIKSVYDSVQTFTLCHESEPVMILSTHDMWNNNESNPTIWKQEHIRNLTKKYKTTGWFNVRATATQKFKVTLFRYPPKARLALNAMASATNEIEGTNIVPFKEGIALPIKTAYLQIDNNQELVAEVDPSKPGCSFEIEIKKGAHKLRANFAEANKKKYAAMFVQIEKVHDK